MYAMILGTLSLLYDLGDVLVCSIEPQGGRRKKKVTKNHWGLFRRHLYCPLLLLSTIFSPGYLLVQYKK